MIGVMLSVGLLAACAADEPAAVVVPTPVSAAEIAAMVQKAIADAPAGVTKADLEATIRAQAGQQITAGDIQTAVNRAVGALAISDQVSQAVAAAVPAATDPAEISKIVEAAVSRGPGVTKSELTAAIRAEVGQQMSAADVKKVVDAAIGAMPAPTVDVAMITPLVKAAVTESVPKGTTPAEIQALVQAAVTVATSQVPTRGDLERAIASEVQKASAGQLTAATVQSIVDASMMATVESVSAAAADSARMAAMDAASLEQDQVLRTVSAYRASSGDRIQPFNIGSYDRIWSSWVYMPLFQFDKNNNLRPGVALSHDVSEDGMVITVTLRPDAVFTDGTQVTARHVKEAWEYALGPEHQPRWGGWSRDANVIQGYQEHFEGDADEITGLVAVNDQTLEITLGMSAPYFPKTLAKWVGGIFKAETAEALGKEAFWVAPIGVGPYTITLNEENGYIELNATDNYWKEPSFIQRVEEVAVDDRQTHLIMYENGDVDIIGARPSLQPTVHDPRHKFNNDFVRMPYDGSHYLAFDSTQSPFTDVKVRAAFMHAADITKVVKAAFGPGVPRGTTVLQPGMGCFDPARQGGYEFDVMKAQQLLAESSYGGPDGLPEPLIVSVRAGRGQWERTYAALQQMWEDNLGVHVTIEATESGQQPSEDTLAVRWSYGDTYGDMSAIQRVVYPPGKFTTNITNPKLTQLVDDANALALNDPGRCDAFLEVEAEFMDNYYIMPIINLQYGFLVQPWVLGFETSINNDFASLPWMRIGKRVR
jgi:ABC-type transport system substrate-binding protein